MKSVRTMAGVSMIDHHCTVDPNMKKALQIISSQNSADGPGLTTKDGDGAEHGDLGGDGRDDVAVGRSSPEGSWESSREQFSIRDYVFAVRSSDIRKNWPFSQRYLKICLENGRKPLLPPFEPSHLVRDLMQEEFQLEALGLGDDTERNNVSCEDTSDYVIEEKVENPKHAENGFLVQEELQMSDTSNKRMASEKSTQCDSVSSADQAGDTVLREDANITGNGIEGIAAESKPKMAGSLAEMRGDLVEENEGSRNSRPNMGTIEETDREVRVSRETEHREKDSDTDTQRLSESADGNHGVTWANSERICKPQCKRTELPEILLDVKSGFTTCKKQANKMLTSEMKSQEEVNRCQKEVKKQEQTVEQNKAETGSEDFVNSGSIPDAMIPKVCPVCGTFSSTSNTALNAHMDHCLAVEPNVEKAVTKFTKHKIKARKKRSMVDICAVAPTRTLEDLEHSTAEQLALDTNLLHLDDFKWRDSKIRRQPRTPLSRGSKIQTDYLDPKAKKRRISSGLKMEYQSNSNKQSQQRDHLDDKDDESRGVKKNRQSALNNYIGMGQHLESSSFNKFNNKLPTISPGKHTSCEDTARGKSQCASQEALMEEPSTRSPGATMWACINKQGNSKAKKFKHKMVNLKSAGIGQPYFNHVDDVPVDEVKLKAKNHTESLPEGTIVASQALPGRFIAPQTEEENDLSKSMPTKRNNAKRTSKISGSSCSPSGEVAEIFTSKRTKHFSSLNFLNKKMRTDSRDQASICENKSPSSGKAQGEEEASFWYCDSNEDKHQSVPNSDEISGNDVLDSQRSENIAVSRILENALGLSVHEKLSTVHCQLPRIRSKEQNKYLMNLGTIEKPNPFQAASESPSKKSSNLGGQAETNCSSEYYNGEEQQAKHFKYSFGSQKMKKVSHIVHDLTSIKDATKIDVGKTVHISECNRKSPRFIYDAASTSNRADSMKHRDCTGTKAQLIFTSEMSVTDQEPRSTPNLQSVAMLASELSTKNLKILTTGKIDHPELPGETQTRVDSTVSTLCQPSQMSCVSAVVGIDGYPQNCALSNAAAQLMSVGSGSLEALSNKESYEHDASVLGMGNQVTARLSPHQGKKSSEFYIASRDHLNSCSSEEHIDIYSDDTLGKKAGSQRQLGAQFISITDALKEKALSVSLQKQTLRHKPSNQAEVFSSNSINLSNRIPMLDSRDPITTSTANISASSNKSLSSQSTVRQLKSHWGSAVSQGTLVLDSIRVAPMSNDTNASDKPQLSSELMTDSAGLSMTGLGKLNERRHAIPQKFGDLPGTVFGHSIHPSSSTSSVGLPLTSQGGLLQERAMLLQDPQLAGSRQCSFGTSMKLTSVTVPQVVSASLLAGNSGEMSVAGEVLHGSMLNLSPPNPQTNPNVVQQSSNNISGLLFEKQNGMKKTLSNLAYGAMDGMNGSCADNHVHGSSARGSNSPYHISTPTSCNGLTWHQTVSGNPFSGSDAVSSSCLATTPEHSDFPQRFPALGHVDCSNEPGVVHIFGNPILRLMGKNVMVSSKDRRQSRQVENGTTSSSEGHTNASCLRPPEFTSEAKMKQEGHSHILCSLERSITLGQNTFQHSEGERRRHSSAFWHSNDYNYQRTTGPQDISEGHVRNLTDLASPSLTGTGLSNADQHLRSTSKKPLSYVSPGLRDHGIMHGPAGIVPQVKWQSPSTVLPQSDPELIIIDDNLGTEATSNEAAFAPPFLQGGVHRLQEGFSIPTHSKFNSKVMSGNNFV